MGDFFRGWRRKAGCVTLVLACVFMVGWVRSFRTVDLVQFESRSAKTNGFTSALGDVGWFQWDRSNRQYLQQTSPRSFGANLRLWQSGPVELFFFVTHGKPFGKNHVLPWRTPIDRNLGSDKSRLESEGIWGPDVIAKGTMMVIPYSNIVITLTLLSAWMLFSKPRPAKSATVQPPTN